jgi:hypothetical protein
MEYDRNQFLQDIRPSAMNPLKGRSDLQGRGLVTNNGWGSFTLSKQGRDELAAYRLAGDTVSCLWLCLSL